MAATQRLLEIMARLRDPEAGCPWDRAQTFATIVPHTIEEAYEVADAIQRDDFDELRDELGDLLFQVVFYAQMAKEAGKFEFDDVVEAIVDKLVRRHPHVFGETNIESAEAQTRAWEAHKAEERRAKAAGAEVPHSVLDGIALTLPALSRAAKLQKRAAQVGFDWPEIDGAVDKIEEELEELREEVGQENQKRINDEMGDLLFSCVNLARFAGVDPESALRGANAKFERRFRGIEALLAAQGTRPEKASLEEMDALWDRVKQEETGAAPVRALNRGRPEGS